MPMLLPSEVLNRKFVLAEMPVENLKEDAEKAHLISTYAVKVGGLGLLLPENDVSELLENQNVCRLPNTPEWFNGVTSIRGNMVPVFDLHRFFELKNSNQNRKMILIGSGEQAVCIWADDMPAMLSVFEDEIEEDMSIPELLKEFSERTFSRNGEVWVDWKVHQFFTTLGQLL